MSLSIGIVGLPNVGKSTLFNTLVRAKQAEASNYPFCTIEPNVGIVEVPDHRLKLLDEVVHAQKVVPAVLEFNDIAGLVSGASKGEGLGNKFLSHIRETDVIVQVVRVFDDPNVIHVDGSVDPKRDIEVIQTELILADLETVTKRLDKLGSKSKSGDKEAVSMKAFFERVKVHLEGGSLAIELELTDDEILWLRDCHLLTNKPFIYLANVSEDHVSMDTGVLYEQWGVSKEAPIIAVCAKMESELAELSIEEASEFLSEYGLTESALDRLIKVGFEKLNLLYYFTAGEKEVRAWTIKKGSKAPQAAGVIHTDFEKGFVKAEIAYWEDFVEFGGFAACRDQGKLRLEGKDYEVQDGDVIVFKIAN